VKIDEIVKMHNQLYLFSMNHKKMCFIFGCIAITLISFGYMIDTDEPYANKWHTIFEFSFLTLLLFGLQAVCYFLGYGIYKMLSRRK